MNVKVDIFHPNTSCNRNRDGLTKVKFGGDTCYVSSVNLNQATMEVKASKEAVSKCCDRYLVNSARIIKGVLHIT